MLVSLYLLYNSLSLDCLSSWSDRRCLTLGRYYLDLIDLIHHDLDLDDLDSSGGVSHLVRRLLMICTAAHRYCVVQFVTRWTSGRFGSRTSFLVVS